MPRVPPKGTVYVYLPDSRPQSTRRKELKFRTAKCGLKCSTRTPLSSNRPNIGYWFPEIRIAIPDAMGLTSSRNLVPAGGSTPAPETRTARLRGGLVSLVETKSHRWLRTMPRTPSVTAIQRRRPGPSSCHPASAGRPYMLWQTQEHFTRVSRLPSRPPRRIRTTYPVCPMHEHHRAGTNPDGDPSGIPRSKARGKESRPQPWNSPVRGDEKAALSSKIRHRHLASTPCSYEAGCGRPRSRWIPTSCLWSFSLAVDSLVGRVVDADPLAAGRR